MTLVSSPSLTSTIRSMCDDLDRLRPQIEAALAYADGTHTFDDVCSMVMTNRVRFWPLANSVLITEVLDYPREKHYHMWLGGGDLQEIIDMHPVIEQAAREAGCNKLSVSGRAGWVKALKPHGWYHAHTTCFKRVSNV